MPRYDPPQASGAAAVPPTVYPQTAHGFPVGTAIYWDGAKYAKATCEYEDRSQVVGLVATVPDANSFTLAKPGDTITVPTALWTRGRVLYLAATPAGELTHAYPSKAHFLKELVLPLSETTGRVLDRAVVPIPGEYKITVSDPPLTFAVGDVLRLVGDPTLKASWVLAIADNQTNSEWFGVVARSYPVDGTAINHMHMIRDTEVLTLSPAQVATLGLPQSGLVYLDPVNAGKLTTTVTTTTGQVIKPVLRALGQNTYVGANLRGTVVTAVTETPARQQDFSGLVNAGTDSEAANKQVPVGGLYRTNNQIKLRLS